MPPGQKTKSKKQVAYLLSRWSPLTGQQKEKLMNELHGGQVRVSGKKR
jgi:hypothetical protein